MPAILVQVTLPSRLRTGVWSDHAMETKALQGK